MIDETYNPRPNRDNSQPPDPTPRILKFIVDRLTQRYPWMVNPTTTMKCTEVDTINHVVRARRLSDANYNGYTYPFLQPYSIINPPQVDDEFIVLQTPSGPCILGQPSDQQPAGSGGSAIAFSLDSVQSTTVSAGGTAMLSSTGPIAMDHGGWVAAGTIIATGTFIFPAAGTFGVSVQVNGDASAANKGEFTLRFVHNGVAGPDHPFPFDDSNGVDSVNGTPLKLIDAARGDTLQVQLVNSSGGSITIDGGSIDLWGLSLGGGGSGSTTLQTGTGSPVSGAVILSSSDGSVTITELGQQFNFQASFNRLSDVLVSSLVTGQVPVWNAASGKWENAAPGALTLPLTTAGDLLYYAPSVDYGLDLAQGKAPGAYTEDPGGDFSGAGAIGPFDGDPLSGWYSNSRGAGPWVQVDLGTPTAVAASHMVEDSIHHMTQYVIQGSPDNITFTTVATSNPTLGVPDSLTWTPATYRYWRLFITAMSSSYGSGVLTLNLYGPSSGGGLQRLPRGLGYLHSNLDLQIPEWKVPLLSELAQSGASSGQVPTWNGSIWVASTPSAGFASPLTTAGDLIVASGGGAAGRLAVGTDSQVLTVDPTTHLPVWATAPTSGFTNPMTTAGDLILGESAGVAGRLAKGADGTILTIDPTTHLPVWSSSSGFANPMTTAGDLILGGSAGVAGRLAKGADATVLTMDPTTHLPVWAASTGGMTNPMTTSQDLIVGGSAGAATRLGVGSNGQVLSVSGGAIVWSTSAASFVNPMTAAGDLIVGGSAGVAARKAIGSTNQLLAVVGGAPAWVDNVTINGTTNHVGAVSLVDALTMAGLANPTGSPLSFVTAHAGFTAINGDRYFCVTFTNSAGETLATTPQLCTAPGGGDYVVDISGIPLGPAGTTGRKLYYATDSGFSAFGRGFETIADNTTTTFHEVFANSFGGPGAIVPTVNTTAGTATLGPVVLGSTLSAGGSVGTSGQVLTSTATGVSWVNSASVGFQNPMTVAGDLILGGAAGAAGRLAKGADNTVLTMDPTTHLPVWAAATGGFTNPMTTQDDIIIGGSAGSAARLAKGTSGQVLTVSSATGHIDWETPTSGGSGLTTASATLGSTVTCNGTTYVDVLSISLIAGTWLVIADIELIIAAADTTSVRLYDGTTVYAVKSVTSNGGWYTPVTVAAIVTVASTTTLKIQGANNTPTTTFQTADPIGGSTLSTRISAVKAA